MMIKSGCFSSARLGLAWLGLGRVGAQCLLCGLALLSATRLNSALSLAKLGHKSYLMVTSVVQTSSQVPWVCRLIGGTPRVPPV